MALATLLLQPAAQIPSIILLDESEQGLHPAAISQFAERDEEKSATILKLLDEKRLKDWLNEYSISELWHKNVIGGRP